MPHNPFIVGVYVRLHLVGLRAQVTEVAMDKRAKKAERLGNQVRIEQLPPIPLLPATPPPPGAVGHSIVAPQILHKTQRKTLEERAEFLARQLSFGKLFPTPAIPTKIVPEPEPQQPRCPAPVSIPPLIKRCCDCIWFTEIGQPCKANPGIHQSDNSCKCDKFQLAENAWMSMVGCEECAIYAADGRLCPQGQTESRSEVWRHCSGYIKGPLTDNFLG